MLYSTRITSKTTSPSPPPSRAMMAMPASWRLRGRRCVFWLTWTTRFAGTSKHTGAGTRMGPMSTSSRCQRFNTGCRPCADHMPSTPRQPSQRSTAGRCAVADQGTTNSCPICVANAAELTRLRGEVKRMRRVVDAAKGVHSTLAAELNGRGMKHSAGRLIVLRQALDTFAAQEPPHGQ